MTRSADIRNADVRDFVGVQIIIEQYLDRGHDGIVYMGHFKKSPSKKVAIKFYMAVETKSLWTQTRLPRFAVDLKARYDNELKRLKTFNHENLQRYCSCGRLKYSRSYFSEFKPKIEKDEEIPFIVSRYIEGESLSEKLKDNLRATHCGAARYLFGIAEGLKYLHKNKMLHGDIRSDNVIISSIKDIPILIDYGLSKGFDENDLRYTQLFINPNPIPSKIYKLINELEKEGRQFDREEIGGVLFPYLDLYHFGLMIQNILESDYHNKLSSFDHHFLEIVAENLKMWDVIEGSNEKRRTCLNGEIKSADDLTRILNRYVNGHDFYNREFSRKERLPPRTIVRMKGITEIRESLTSILEHPTLGRLHNLRQLSLLNYIYTSAGQSRFDHTLSVLGRVQQIWRALARDPNFLFFMGIDDIERLEIVALLHDINHFPFLHYFQEAGIPKVQRADILDTLFSIENNSTPNKRYNTLKQEIEKWGINIEYMRTLISDKVPVNWKPQDQIINSIINSGIDADKLAYLPDDASFTGASFGLGIDIFGILDNIEIAQAPYELEKVWHIIFSKDALPAVESVCFSRYWNFRRIYWHHTNRAIASMVIWTIRELYSRPEHSLIQYLIDTKNLGEAGALEYISEKYRKAFNEEPPIAGLATNRSLIYKRIFDMSSEENDNLLLSFQDEEIGIKKHKEAQKNLHKVVSYFLKSVGFKETIRSCEVILDIPRRKMDLGGNIFIRGNDGRIEKAIIKSPVLKQLEESFGAMSKVFRVFVSPRIRSYLSKIKKAKASQLNNELYNVIFDKKPDTEVK